MSTKDSSDDPAKPKKETSLYTEFLRDLRKRWAHDMKLQEAGALGERTHGIGAEPIALEEYPGIGGPPLVFVL